MNTLASGFSYLDLHFLDTPRVIASVILSGPDGVAIIDPGPSSTLTALRAGLARAGIAIADVRTVLLTHIHLDHAGATGTLLAENPALRSTCTRSAPHMVDPSKLMASATRLWGDDMDRLWGRDASGAGGCDYRASRRRADCCRRPRSGGRAHRRGMRRITSATSAGDAGIAFVGDTAGARLLPGGFNMPPTPPPDIDLEAWRESLSIIDHALAARAFLVHHALRSGRAGRAALDRDGAENLDVIDQRSGEGVAG